MAGAVRGVIRRMLESQVDIEVVGEAGNGREAIDIIWALDPDVALMDLQMPVIDGVGALVELARTDTAVLVVGA